MELTEQITKKLDISHEDVPRFLIVLDFVKLCERELVA